MSDTLDFYRLGCGCLVLIVPRPSGARVMRRVTDGADCIDFAMDARFHAWRSERAQKVCSIPIADVVAVAGYVAEAKE